MCLPTSVYWSTTESHDKKQKKYRCNMLQLLYPSFRVPYRTGTTALLCSSSSSRSKTPSSSNKQQGTLADKDHLSIVLYLRTMGLHMILPSLPSPPPRGTRTAAVTSPALFSRASTRKKEQGMVQLLFWYHSESVFVDTCPPLCNKKYSARAPRIFHYIGGTRVYENWKRGKY